MGDRINLRFVEEKNGKQLDAPSPVLYAHWDGMSLISGAELFWNEYKGKIRTEPSNWMVNFISYLKNGDVSDGGYYLYPDFKSACSADDNGDWEFNVSTGEYRQVTNYDL